MKKYYRDANIDTPHWLYYDAKTRKEQSKMSGKYYLNINDSNYYIHKDIRRELISYKICHFNYFLLINMNKK